MMPQISTEAPVSVLRQESGQIWNRSKPLARPYVLALRRILTAALPFVIVVFVWQLFGSDSGARSVFLPTPMAVGAALGNLVTDSGFYVDVGWSMYR